MQDTGNLRVHKQRPRLTPKVNLRGEQDRLRQMILYISEKCAQAERMGLIKLNKILWKADFDAFASRHVPVTGRAYQRLALGPAPREMRPLLREMNRDGLLHFEETDFGDGVIEMRPIADKPSALGNFTPEDISYVDAAIAYYWNMNGRETSDDSHGIAWRSRNNNDPMYYELAFLSDAPVSPRQIIGLTKVIKEKKKRSLHSK
jgi:hypothetical protein